MPGIGRLLVGGNRVDVGGRAGRMLQCSQFLRPDTQSCQEFFDAARSLPLKDVLQRLQPLPVLHLRTVRRQTGTSVRIDVGRHGKATRGQIAGSGKGIDNGWARRAALSSQTRSIAFGNPAHASGPILWQELGFPMTPISRTRAPLKHGQNARAAFAWDPGQALLILIFFRLAWASSLLGSLIVSTPLLNSASALFSSTSAGRSITRSKEPRNVSWR